MIRPVPQAPTRRRLFASGSVVVLDLLAQSRGKFEGDKQSHDCMAA